MLPIQLRRYQHLINLITLTYDIIEDCETKLVTCSDPRQRAMLKAEIQEVHSTLSQFEAEAAKLQTKIRRRTTDFLKSPGNNEQTNQLALTN